METPLHQEWRSRQHVDWAAVVKTTIIAGLVMFVMSGGSPWSTGGTMNAMMGRDMRLGMFTLLAWHLALSFVYVSIIAEAIFQLRLVAGLMVGFGVGMILYAFNYAIFHGLNLHMQSPEGRALFTHATFSLVAAAAYKALSVPRPFHGGEEEVLAQTHRSLHRTHRRDPEPRAADRP